MKLNQSITNSKVHRGRHHLGITTPIIPHNPVMPEYAEFVANAALIKDFIQSIPEKGRAKSLLLLAILVDSTDKEQDKAKRGTLACQGHVYEVLSHSDIVRGQRMSQTRIYPSEFGGRNKSLKDLQISLFDVKFTPRSVDLDFKNHYNSHYWAQASTLKLLQILVYVLIETLNI